MTSHSLARFLKSHWPAAIIAVAVLAFLAGAFTSNRGVADEPAPATTGGSPPAYTPSPPTPLPTAAAGGASSSCVGFLAPSGICIPEPTPASSSGWGPAYSGVEITLSGGRTLELPSDVYIAGRIDNVFCYVGDGAPPCPQTPLYMLKKGDSVVEIDFNGNVEEGDGSPFRPSDFAGVLGEFFSIDGNDVWDPEAFPFLPEFQGD